jgi:hypothetical protein
MNTNGIIEKKSGLKKKKQAHSKWLCCHCLKSGKGNGTCGQKDHLIIPVSHKIHFIPITASKTRWKQLLKNIGSYGSISSNLDVLMETINNK